MTQFKSLNEILDERITNSESAGKTYDIPENELRIR